MSTNTFEQKEPGIVSRPTEMGEPMCPTSSSPAKKSRSSTSRATARRLLTGLVLTVAMALASVVGLAGSAQAAASGCNYWNPFTAGGYSLAGGQYCVAVQGSGTWIYNVSTNFVSVGNICNWDVTAEYFDRNWRYSGNTFVSGRNYGCTHGATASIYQPYYISQLVGSNYGYMCSTLRVANQRVTSVCHYIHP